ncbi:MAG: Ig-like domain-containing protein [Candidatus Moraniibacteriota bacterium]
MNLFKGGNLNSQRSGNLSLGSLCFFKSVFIIASVFVLFGTGEEAQAGYAETLVTNEYQGAGTAQGWRADDSAWTYTLPFTFNFYGTDYSSIKVSSNGYICFNSAYACSATTQSLAGTNGPIIALLARDLKTNTLAENNIFITANADNVVIRWNAVVYGQTAVLNFEAVLYSNGAIKFNYGPQSAISAGSVVGVSKGDGANYVVSTYNNATNLNLVNTASWVYIPSTLPTVDTVAVSNITPVSATANGNVTNTGNENLTRSMEWGTVSGTYTGSCTAGIGGLGAYTCNMTGLIPNTTYYVRAKIVNSVGTAYGTESSFQTAPAIIPTVSTSAVSSITGITATGNGNVTNTGGENPTRYIEWGTVSGTYTNSCSAGVGAAGAYICSMTGLSLNTTYYVRAKATNSAGTGYGSEVSFATRNIPTVTTQNVSAITAITATGNGTIIDTGGVNPTRYIEWGTVSGTYTNSCNASTGGTGAYTCSMTSLSPATTYYFRAKATNIAGTAYGTELSFQTAPITAPTLTTSAVTSITGNSAVGNGNVTYTGGNNPARYIEWGTVSGSYTNSCSAGVGGTGNFSCSMTGLSNYTTYYVRAKAVNIIGESYGSEVTFTTSAVMDLANNYIHTSAIQSDGKVIIGGRFTTYNGFSRKHIARINPDGSLDTSFDPGVGPSSYINAIAVQSDGKIVIGGEFNLYGGVARQYIARINADGTLDTTFTVGTGANYYVYATAIQSDGKIIIGGYFGSYNGTSRNRIARLNTDGTLDATFNPNSGTNISSTVYSTIIQPDGKILIGGTFSSYNGTPKIAIARINTDGTLDATFNTGMNTNSIVRTISIRADGKIVAGGDFGILDNAVVVRRNIAQLNSDGTLDFSFNSGNGTSLAYPWVIYSTAIQPDGKVLIGGEFTNYDGTTRNRIARINIDGTLDASFNVGTGTSSTVLTTVIQPDGKIVIGGYFSTYNGVSRNRIARLNADGSGDNIFGETPHAAFVATNAATSIIATSAIGNGNVLNTGGDNPERVIEWGTVSGTYTDSCSAGVGGTGVYSCNLIGLTPSTTYYIRAKTTNLLGTSYGSEISFTTTPVALPVLTTQAVSIITATTATGNGNISNTGGDNPERMIEWGTVSGTYTNSCTAGIGGTGVYSCSMTGLASGVTYYARAKATNQAGTAYGSQVSFRTVSIPIVITDSVMYISSTSATINGNIDVNNSGTALYIEYGISSGNYSIGSCIANSFYTSLTGSLSCRISELIPDTTYYARTKSTNVAGTGFGNEISFKTRKVDADGERDTSFLEGAGAGIDDGWIVTSVIQPDGKILIGGWFTSYGGSTRNGIARLNSDGTLDNTFDPGLGASYTEGGISSIAVQSDGKIIIGGYFTNYNNSVDAYVCRDAEYSCDSPSFIDYNNGGAACAADTVNCDDANDCGTSMLGYADARAACGYDVSAVNHIARLNSDGSLDSSFNVGTGTNYSDLYGVYAISIQADGKILIGGEFSSYNGTDRNNIARLNADGTLDTNFNIGSGITDEVNAIAIQSDGKILVGGFFDSGTDISGIARLNSDGSLDSTFNTVMSGGQVRAIAIQSDDKILIGGDYFQYGGSHIGTMLRLNTDGSFDANFNSNADVYYWYLVNAIAVQSDGKIIVGGSSHPYFQNMYIMANVARLNRNGTIDYSFESGEGPNSDIFAVAIQPDDKVVISGWLDSYNKDAIEINGITRLFATSNFTEPIISTGSSVYASENVASVTGIVSDTGGENPSRFIEWGTTSGNYTNSCSAGIGGAGDFSCNMTGLTLDNIYYVRAKATNSAGTSYGEEVVYIHEAFLTESIVPNEFQGGGIAQNWKGDEETWAYELPFDFTFYGTTYPAGTSIGITSNGQICLEDSVDCAEFNNNIASTDHGPFIAPLWFDLDSTDVGDIYITENVDNVVIRWETEEYDVSGVTINFEAILFADGNIKFNYGPQSDELTYVGASVGISRGDGVYTASVYDNLTDFNNIDTSAWGDFGISMVSQSPADNAAFVARDSSLTATFDRNVIQGSGNILIKKKSDNAVLETIDVTSTNVTGWSSDILEINPTSLLPPSSQIYINIEPGAIKDTENNDFEGITDTDTWNFSTINTIVKTIPTGACYKVGSAELTQPANTVLSYSNDDQITWTYTPVAQGDGGDCNVTDIKLLITEELGSISKNLEGDFTGIFTQTETTSENGEGVTLTNLGASIGTYTFDTRINWDITISQYLGFGSHIAHDASGNLFIGGSFDHAIDFDGTNGVDIHTPVGDDDAYITKYNADGSYGWTRTFGGADTESGGGIAVDGLGNVFLTGAFRGNDIADFDGTSGTDMYTPSSESDSFITKYNADGSYGWTRIVVGNFEWSERVAADALGNAYVTGSFTDTVDFDGTAGIDNRTSRGSYDISLTKYNADGSYGWTRILGGAGSEDAPAIATDDFGHVLVLGQTSSVTVDFDDTSGVDNLTTDTTIIVRFLTKYNTDGSYGWTRLFSSIHGGTGDLAIDSSGNAFVTGSFRDEADFDGTSGLDIIAAATTLDNNAFLTKYNADGSYGWTHTFGGDSNTEGYNIAIDFEDDIFITGSFEHTVDFDGTAGTDNRTSRGTDDIFFTKYNADGSYGWTRTMGNENIDYPGDVSADGAGHVYVTGDFEGAVDFDGTDGVDIHESRTDNFDKISGFLTKYNSDGTYGSFGLKSYEDSGSYKGVINANDNIFIKQLQVDMDAPSNTAISYTVLDGSCDNILMESSTVETAIDLTSLGTLEICLQFNFSTSNSLVTPQLNGLSVGYSKERNITDFSYELVASVGPQIILPTPANNAADVLVGINIVSKFDRIVEKGTGKIHIKKKSDDSIIESIDVEDSNITGWGTDTLTIDPTNDLPANTEIYINIDPTALVDSLGNFFFGISDNSTWTFTTGAGAGPQIILPFPTDNATNISPDSNLTINFDRVVEVGTGNIDIINATDDSIIETIDITSPNVTGWGTDTLTIDPTNNLPANTPIYINIDSTAVVDTLGNFFFGINDSTTWTFTTGSTVGPQIITPMPDNNATNIDPTADLTINFDRPVEVGTGNIEIINATDDSIIETIDITSANVTGWSTDTLTINPTNNLPSNTPIYINIDPTAIVDTLGNYFFGITDNATWTFTTGSTVGPQIILPTPANNAADVQVNINIVSKFDRIVEKGTGKIHIKKKSDDSIIEEIDVEDSNITGWGTDTLTIDPTNDLPGNTEIYINIEPTALVDSLNNYFFGITDSTTWTFTTQYIGPQIITPLPADNATNIDPTADLTINFDRPVEVGTGDIDIINATDDSIIETIDITSENVTGWSTDTLTINPTNDLPGSTEIYINIDPTAIVDTLGNYFFGITDNTTWTFTTQDNTTEGPQIIAPTPSDDATNIALDADLVINFDRPVEPGTGNIEIIQAQDDTIIEAIDVNSDNITGWGSDTLTINPTDNLPADTDIYINIEPGAVVDTLGNYFFGINDSSTWSFRTGDASTVGPQLINPSPANNSTNISPDANLSTKFDRPVYPGEGNFHIKNKDDNSEIETIDVNSSNITGWSTDTLTINPINDLPVNTEVYITIDSGALKDVSGSFFFGITDPATWNFITGEIDNDLEVEIISVKDIQKDKVKVRVEVKGNNKEDEKFDFKVEIKNKDDDTKDKVKIKKVKVSDADKATLEISQLLPSTSYSLAVSVSEVGEDDYSKVSDSKSITTLEDLAKLEDTLTETQPITTDLEDTLITNEEERQVENQETPVPVVNSLEEDDNNREDKKETLSAAVTTTLVLIGLIPALTNAFATTTIPFLPLTPGVLRAPFLLRLFNASRRKFLSALRFFPILTISSNDKRSIPFDRKENNKFWGVVFDSYTKQPIMDAVIYLVSLDKKRVIEHVVTDEQGRYGFLIGETGRYALEVKKGIYQIATTTKEDSLYGNIYTQPIDFNSGDLFHLNVALLAPNFNWHKFSQDVIRRYNSFSFKFLSYLLDAIYVAGMILSIYNVIYYPSFFNYLALAFYIGLLIFRLIFKDKKKFGIVSKKETKSPLPFTVVALHDIVNKQRLNFAVTDVLGRYYLLAKNGSYALKLKYIDMTGGSYEKEGVANVEKGIFKKDFEV